MIRFSIVRLLQCLSRVGFPCTVLATCAFTAPSTLAQDTESTYYDDSRTVRTTAQPRVNAKFREFRMRIKPAPTNLPLVDSSEAKLRDHDIVMGVVYEGNVVAFPVRFLSATQVANATIGNTPVVPTWCPVSGSGIVYARRVWGQELTFDAGEGWINNNLLIVDRETNSVWSQIDGKAISGPQKGTTLRVIPSIQATWLYWKTLHPQTKVMVDLGSIGVGYYYRSRMPGQSAIGVRTGEHVTGRLGLGVAINDEARFFPFLRLMQTKKLITVTLGGEEITVHHDKEGLTVWATDQDGDLLPGVLVYNRNWLAFHPKSKALNLSGR